MAHVEIAFGSAGLQSDWFEKINPNGFMPAIQDGEVTLWESLAINLYLAKRYGKELYPGRIEDEARAWQWTLWAATELEPHVVAMLEHGVLLPPEQRSEDAVKSAMDRIQKPLKVLNDALANTAYLLGDSFTVADLNIAAVLLPAYDNGWVVAKHPNIMTWLSSCWARPAARELREQRSAEKQAALGQYWEFFRSSDPKTSAAV